MAEPDGFHGSWELVPELSIYELGPVPASGRYEIASVGDAGLEVSIRWTMEAGGPEHSTTFGGQPDGQPVALAGAGSGPGPDAFSLTRVDARTLDSAALRQGAVVAYARRVASHDGRLLAVVQEGPRPDGSRFRNFQVYRRVGDDDIE
jgi:hypothetical protein